MRTAGVLMAVVATVATTATPPVGAQAALDVVHVRGGIYMIAGPGGNTTVQIGADGVLLVDPQPAAIGRSWYREARSDGISATVTSRPSPRERCTRFE